MHGHQPKNPSVRGGNRGLRMRDQHPIVESSLYRELPEIDGTDDVFAMIWRLPEEELIARLPGPSPDVSWNYRFHVFHKGILMTTAPMKGGDWPLKAGDLLVKLGDVSVEGLPYSDNDAYNELQGRVWWGPLQLRFRREVKPSISDQQLWWIGLFAPELRAVPSAKDPLDFLTNDIEALLHPRLADICNEWYDTFAEPTWSDRKEELKLSRVCLESFLNSAWLSFQDPDRPLPSCWQAAIDAKLDSRITREEFLVACATQAKKSPHVIRKMLRAWGWDAATLEPSQYASKTAAALAAKSFASLLRTLANIVGTNALKPTMAVLFDKSLQDRINSFLVSGSSKFLVFTIGVEGFPNPKQLLAELATIGLVSGHGTLLDVRCGHTMQKSFRPKSLREACESHGLRYFEPKVDSCLQPGNVAIVRGLEPPCVLIDNKASLEESQHRVDWATRLVLHGVADVIHLRRVCVGASHEGHLAYALHPGSMLQPCVMPSHLSAGKFRAGITGPEPILGM